MLNRREALATIGSLAASCFLPSLAAQSEPPLVTEIDFDLIEKAIAAYKKFDYRPICGNWWGIPTVKLASLNAILEMAKHPSKTCDELAFLSLNDFGDGLWSGYNRRQGPTWSRFCKQCASTERKVVCSKCNHDLLQFHKGYVTGLAGRIILCPLEIITQDDPIFPSYYGPFLEYTFYKVYYDYMELIEENGYSIKYSRDEVRKMYSLMNQFKPMTVDKALEVLDYIPDLQITLDSPTDRCIHYVMATLCSIKSMN